MKKQHTKKDIINKGVKIETNIKQHVKQNVIRNNKPEEKKIK